MSRSTTVTQSTINRLCNVNQQDRDSLRCRVVGTGPLSDRPLISLARPSFPMEWKSQGHSEETAVLTPDPSSMHNELRHHLLLLIFALASNDMNASGLPLLEVNRKYKPINLADDAHRGRVTHAGILNALATLSIRGHEVVATSFIPPNVLATCQVSCKRCRFDMSLMPANFLSL